MPAKPKLVFFRKPLPNLPRFVVQHLDEHVACLEHHFDVVLVDDDCDYAEVCETHEPDLALFESGVYAAGIRIERTDAFPEVPKLGFCNSDAYCATRAVFLSDMERWGVETFFTLSVAMAEYTPEIADRLFVWPNFIDPTVYRDYGLPKSVPVLFTGSQATHYPWRSRVHAEVTQRFPSLTTPHAGWFDEGAAGRMVVGERYARLLNASSVAPTCGTIAREVIRKHFEIPATGALLITERTEALEAAGFHDLVNVVYAEPDDVCDKLDHLFAHPDELERIARAGQQLVHERHTMAQRDQLLQWLRLHRTAGPGERIVQDGPFEALRLAPATGAANAHPRSGGIDRSLLEQGRAALDKRRLDDAETCFQRCLNYHFMPEPVLGLVRTNLLRGDVGAAAGWIAQAIERSLVLHHAADPDPVEWAYYIRTLLCGGELAEALRRSRQLMGTTHRELARVRRATATLAGVDAPVTTRPARASLHVLPASDDPAWTDELRDTLLACGQPELAAALSDGRPAAGRGHLDVAGGEQDTGAALLPLFTVSPITRAKSRARAELGARWRRRAVGRPQFAMRSVVAKEDVSDALLIGASALARSTRAVVSGLRRHPNRPSIVWLNDTTPARLPSRVRGPGERITDARGLDDRQRCFDLVLVGRLDEHDEAARAHVDGARLVVLYGINGSGTHRLHTRLIEDPDYALIAHLPEHDGGSSMFRRLRA